MSNVIRFLESMGADAAMARMTAADYEAAIAMLEVDDSCRQALQLRDHSKLNGLLNGRPIMFCAIAAPEEKPEQEDGVPAEEEGGGEEKKGE